MQSSAAQEILLVEDNPDLREALAEFLATRGYRVRAFSSAEAAIAGDTADREAPDLLITDLCLPGINGVTLAEFLRCRRPDLPVIVVSTLLYAQDLRQHSRLQFLAKPFAMSDLEELVRKALIRGVDRACATLGRVSLP